LQDENRRFEERSAGEMLAATVSATNGNPATPTTFFLYHSILHNNRVKNNITSK
jgi:hypothetical protein